jgi:hypothetical protein
MCTRRIENWLEEAGLELTTGAHSHLHRVINGVRYHLVEQFDAVLTVQLADLVVDVFPA